MHTSLACFTSPEICNSNYLPSNVGDRGALNTEYLTGWPNLWYSQNFWYLIKMLNPHMADLGSSRGPGGLRSHVPSLSLFGQVQQ